MDKLPPQTRPSGMLTSYTQLARSTFFNLLFFNSQLILLIDLLLLKLLQQQEQDGS